MNKIKLIALALALALAGCAGTPEPKFLDVDNYQDEPTMVSLTTSSGTVEAGKIAHGQMLVCRHPAQLKEIFEIVATKDSELLRKKFYELSAVRQCTMASAAMIVQIFERPFYRDDLAGVTIILIQVGDPRSGDSQWFAGWPVYDTPPA